MLKMLYNWKNKVSHSLRFIKDIIPSIEYQKKFCRSDIINYYLKLKWASLPEN